MQNEQLYLVLGCFGRRESFKEGLQIVEFVSCAGCENRILTLNTAKVNNYNAIMDYFDSCRLFDKPIFEYSAINHFIRNVRDKFDQIVTDKPIWSETQYNLYQKFNIDHRLCGLYIKLILIDPSENQIPKFEEKGVIIKGKDNLPIHTPKLNLNLIRGRKR